MSETVTKNAEKEARQTYKVEVEPENFEPDCDSKFISSVEFCKLTNEIFKAAFADFIGSTFEINQGTPVVSLYFTHEKVDGVCAVQRADKEESGSSLLDKTRSRDLLYREGDRYLITDNGIDVIKELLLPKTFNGGKPNWKNLVSDIIDRNAANYYNPMAQTQITKITGIDPRNLCQLIYGKKSGDSYTDYGIQVVGDRSFANGMMPGQASANYILSITRAYNGHLQKTYEKFGITNAGSAIIR